ncbi:MULTISPECIES: carboxylic acid reductase [unclassified Micromonospora]|uniref:carboxylic acid reductase n=1 Tax=unclassified Micromonospora TaxID=2617518 RepID=UPI0036404E79
MRLAETMATALQKFGDRPALAERSREIHFDIEKKIFSVRPLPRYETISYQQLWERVQATAAQLSGHSSRPVAPGDRAAILGFASCDYVTVDLACNYLGVVVVPLQTSASTEQLASILDETEPTILIVSSEHLREATQLAERTLSVARVMVFDYRQSVTEHAEAFTQAAERLATTRGVPVEPLDDRSGRTVGEIPPHGSPDEKLAMLMYTSGSTGTPKGAMYTERLVSEMWGGAGWSEFFAEDQAVTTLHYVPMSHVAGHSSVKGTLARGGVSYFSASSDLSTFLDDIRLTRPTEMSFVPRVCELIYQHYQARLHRVRPGMDPEAHESAVLSEIRNETLGGRIAWASCTSAPVSQEMKAFIEKLLGIELHILYGTTEIGGVLADGRFLRPPVIDYRLVDVPELGYYRTDSPHPRGELLVKSESTVPGYYRQPELTQAAFDQQGYYRTGDIAAEIAPGNLTIIDRKNAVVKLSQGEFVALPSLESVYTAGSPLVHQMFLYSNSEKSFLVGVVVPTEDARERYGITSPHLEQAILDSLREVAAKEHLKSYEIPKGIVAEDVPFSIENGLLSDHRKLLRPQAAKRYSAALEELYRSITESSDRLLRDVRETGGDRPVLETLLRAVGVVVGDASASHDPRSRFRDLGGDSLSAVALADLLQEIYQVRVPVDVIISPSYALGRIARYISDKRADDRHRPSVVSVHGSHRTEVRAADLTLAKFFDTESLEPAALSGQVEPRTVLLTGASGYLGRFLCLEWLERLAARNGKLICLVRGEDAEAATARLRDSLSSDPLLRHHFDQLATQHLEVLAGDIAEQQLGLSDAVWSRLGAEVDLIVHVGALVNHVLPYAAMFESNVVGTAELIRLALTTRTKGFTYLSSVAVATADPSGTPVDEASDIRTRLPQLPVEGKYAAGYAASKWAGEVLLREAHEKYHLPVTVFRSSMILAHSVYRGQLNAPDVFSRLLHGIVRTRTAPASFYQGDPAAAHYDGLPVDFTARTIGALGQNEEVGFRTFNLVNPNEDGISLDRFVDWLIDRGYAIERIASYQDWRQRFEHALRTLPEHERRHSALPLVHAFNDPEPSLKGSPVPSDLFQEAVRAASLDGVGAVPSLSADLIEKYVHDLEFIYGFTAFRVTTE